MDKNIILNSAIEKRFLSADEASEVCGYDLIDVKRSLNEMLKLIGRGMFFSEYTLHDISHINELLQISEWLVADGIDSLTASESLMLVLAIYFHDLGMLVTEDEYSERDKTNFETFKAQELFSGSGALDYREKIDSLGAEIAERFFYMEFVRRHHAERIENWILGKSSKVIGSTAPVTGELANLLKRLPPQFLYDLGKICRSHHLDDLDDVDKYSTRRRYGNSDDDLVDLQYVAIILRSADLLHMTRNRTPSVMYRLVNPFDPISQIEWGKQMGVSSVCPKEEPLKDGNREIEVHAFFDNGDAFFSLSAFLDYVDSQLRQSHSWIKNTKRTKSKKFPWMAIDRRHIETVGFEEKKYEFVIDKVNILNLLTGHTLYNSTDVVIRELIQNSLDAVRFKSLLIKRNQQKSYRGMIKIYWDEKAELTVVDNGTGMSMEVVERNLLRVGASRYREKDIKEKFPAFSPISRFGIGVLSYFMVADSVEILTKEEDTEYGLHIELRKATGEYLIRKIDPKEDDSLDDLLPHGTQIRLNFRKDALIENIEEVIRKWIVFPEAEVVYIDGGGETKKIGYSSPKDKLLAMYKEGDLDDKKMRINEFALDGMDVAVMEVFIPYYNYWRVPKTSEIVAEFDSGEYSHLSHCDLCIEGVSVIQETPGFTKNGPAIIVNSKGNAGLKTNVSRDAIEAGPAGEKELLKILRLLLEMIDKSFQRDDVGLSSNAKSTIIHKQVTALIESSVLNRHQDALKLVEKLPMYVIEKDGQKFVSYEFLDSHDFWTVLSEDFNSVMGSTSLIPSPSKPSLVYLYNVFFERYHPLPQPLLVSTQNLDISNFRPKIIKYRDAERRVDISWKKQHTKNSEEVSSLFIHTSNAGIRGVSGGCQFDILIIPGTDCEIENIDESVALLYRPAIIIHSQSRLAKTILQFLRDFPSVKNDLESDNLYIGSSIGMMIDPESIKDSIFRPNNEGTFRKVYGDDAFARLLEIEQVANSETSLEHAFQGKVKPVDWIDLIDDLMK